jgi:hypothetical protein
MLFTSFSPFLAPKCRLQRAFYYDIAIMNAIHVTVRNDMKTCKLDPHLFLISALHGGELELHTPADLLSETQPPMSI